MWSWPAKPLPVGAVRPANSTLEGRGLSSEILEPLQESGIRLPSGLLGIDGSQRSQLVHRSALGFEVDRDVAVRRLHARVPQPVTDRYEIDSRLQHVGCRRTALIPSAE